MKKEYKNATITKQKIRDAVIHLYEKEKDLTKISITDVVRSAKINRGSFYNHYNNVREVIAELEDELMHELMVTLDEATKVDNTAQKFINTIVDFLEEKEPLYRPLARVAPKNMLDALKNKFLKEFKNNTFSHINSTKKGLTTIQFLANGLTYTYLDYLEGKTDASLHELGEMAIILFDNILKNYIRQPINFSTNSNLLR